MIRVRQIKIDALNDTEEMLLKLFRNIFLKQVKCVLQDIN